VAGTCHPLSGLAKLIGERTRRSRAPTSRQTTKLKGKPETGCMAGVFIS
jgi:hypothetical protein